MKPTDPTILKVINRSFHMYWATLQQLDLITMRKPFG